MQKAERQPKGVRNTQCDQRLVDIDSRHDRHTVLTCGS